MCDYNHNFRHYHNEKDIDEEPQPLVTAEESSSTSIITTTTVTPTTTTTIVAEMSINVESSTETPEINLTNNNNIIEEPISELDISSSFVFEETDGETSNRDSWDEKSRSNVLAEINIEAKNNRNIEKVIAMTILSASISPISLTQTPSTETELEPKPSCSTTSCESISPPSSVEISSNTSVTIIKPHKTGNKQKSANINNNSKHVKPSLMTSEVASTSMEGNKVKKLSPRTTSIANQQNTFTPNPLSSRGDSDSSGRYSINAYDSGRSEKKEKSLHSVNLNLNTGNSSNKVNRKLSKNETDLLGAPTSGCMSSRTPRRSSTMRKLSLPRSNINISSDFCKDSDQTNGDEQSNMFLYIDLHGHASKKGIFMYGNYLPNIAESVECMLLPRLMSLNSHHFHFDACVFSERNMYHKYVKLAFHNPNFISLIFHFGIAFHCRGKRDGLSKEGSGRVAIYKTIGLVKSYTLEANYNTGKIVNTLPAREKDLNSPKVCSIPPKYTPAIFEEVCSHSDILLCTKIKK